MDHTMKLWDGAMRTALLNPTSQLGLTDKAMLNNLREDFMVTAFSAFKKRVTSIIAPPVQGGDAEEVKYGLNQATNIAPLPAQEAAKDSSVAAALRGLKQIQKVLEAKPASSSMASDGPHTIPGLGRADRTASQPTQLIKSEHSKHSSVEDADAFLQDLQEGLQARPTVDSIPTLPPNGTMPPDMMISGTYPPTPIFTRYAPNQPNPWFINQNQYYASLLPYGGYQQPSATGNGTHLAFPQREPGRLTPVTPNAILPGTAKSHQARRHEANRASQNQHRAPSTINPRPGSSSSAHNPPAPAPTKDTSRFDRVCPNDLLGRPCPRDDRAHRRYPCDGLKICKRGTDCNSQYCGDLHIKRTCKSYVHNGKCDGGPNCAFGHDRVAERRRVADRARAHELGGDLRSGNMMAFPRKE